MLGCLSGLFVGRLLCLVFVVVLLIFNMDFLFLFAVLDFFLFSGGLAGG